jgi:hypothetical protein
VSIVSGRVAFIGRKGRKKMGMQAWEIELLERQEQERRTLEAGRQQVAAAIRREALLMVLKETDSIQQAANFIVNYMGDDGIMDAWLEVCERCTTT